MYLGEAGVDCPHVPHELRAILAGVEAGAAGREQEVANVAELLLVAVEAAEDHARGVRHAPYHTSIPVPRCYVCEVRGVRKRGKI